MVCVHEPVPFILIPDTSQTPETYIDYKELLAQADNSSPGNRHARPTGCVIRRPELLAHQPLPMHPQGSSAGNPDRSLAILAIDLINCCHEPATIIDWFVQVQITSSTAFTGMSCWSNCARRHLPRKCTFSKTTPLPSTAYVFWVLHSGQTLTISDETKGSRTCALLRRA